MLKITLTMVLRSFGLMLIAALLVACGGGGVVPGTRDAAALRPLPTEYVTRSAAAYGPFRINSPDAPSTEPVTTAHILQDLNLLIQGNITLIRMFDSSDKVAKQVLQTIKDNHLDMKVHLGCWISSEKSAKPADVPAIEQANQLEIARCIALANAYPDIVLVVSVGNECMVSWSFNSVTPAQMASYITQVRSAIAQPSPRTTTTPSSPPRPPTCSTPSTSCPFIPMRCSTPCTASGTGSRLMSPPRAARPQ